MDYGGNVAGASCRWSNSVRQRCYGVLPGRSLERPLPRVQPRGNRGPHRGMDYFIGGGPSGHAADVCDHKMLCCGDSFRAWDILPTAVRNRTKERSWQGETTHIKTKADH